MILAASTTSLKRSNTRSKDHSTDLQISKNLRQSIHSCDRAHV